jgi:hypothetical protein
VALLVAVFGGGVAHGDSPAASSDLSEQFGGYTMDSHAEGLTITYTSPGLIPGTPDTLGALDLPEALTNMDNGPSGYALASLAYPGPLLADLPSALALMGIPNANQIPGYPLRAQAFYPSGPASADQSFGPGRQVVHTDATTSTAQASFSAVQLNAVMSAGSVTSSSQSELAQGKVISRSRVEVSGLDILAGLIHIGSLTTDLVATSDGTSSATAGTTTVSDVTLLGLPATIDATGVHLTPAAGADGSGTSGTMSTTAPPNPLLGQLSPLLQPVADGLSAVLRSTLGSVDAGVNALLNQGGIDIRTIPVSETKDGAEASRLAGGLSITLHYDGKTEPVMSQILDLIPANQLPSQGLGPIPFSSPQALVQLLRATHIIAIGMAAANVHVAAAPPFELPSSGDGGSSAGDSGNDIGSSPTGVAGGSGGSFSTPLPAIPAAKHSGGSGAGASTAKPAAFHGAAPLAAAAGVLLALLIGLSFGFGSRRVADDVLAAGARSCPEGLDRPPDPPTHLRSPT